MDSIGSPLRDRWFTLSYCLGLEKLTQVIFVFPNVGKTRFDDFPRLSFVEAWFVLGLVRLLTLQMVVWKGLILKVDRFYTLTS